MFVISPKVNPHFQMSSVTLSPNHTRLDCLLKLNCCSLIAVTTMVRTSVASRAFSICFQIFWTCFRVSTPQNPISSAHYLVVNLFCSVVEFPAIASFIFIAVFATCTKSFWPVTLTLTPPLTPLTLNLSEVLPPSVPPYTYQLLLQDEVFARPSTFEMGGGPCSCLFLQHLCLNFFPSRRSIPAIQ